MLSERWRIFQERLMTSCEPIEDLMPLRISITFQDIEDFANLITYWGLWGRWLIFEDFEVALNTFCGPMRTSRDLRPFWGNRGDFEDHLRTWGLRTLGTFCAFSLLFEDFVDLLRTFWRPWTWGSQNIEEPFRNFWWLLVEHLRTVFRNIWGLCEDHLMTIWGTFDDHSILRTLITFWGIEVALNTFCGPLRTSRALMTFWGIWGHFEDQLRTWGLRTLDTLCAFSWLFEDFLNPLRNFGRSEDLMLSERWRIFQELLMTSCKPIEDLMPLRISMTFQDIEDFANLITYWGLWGRW